jgi:two-component system, OmpR family, sensor kinase
MSFRARMILAVTLMTLVTMGVAFAVISVTVNRSQERHFDQALLDEARTEAAGLARHGKDWLGLSARLGPTPNHVAPLTLYGALYTSDGHLLQVTPSFGGVPPALSPLQRPRETCFDFHSGPTHLRAVITNIPGRPDRLLLVALPRQDLDGDAVFLRRAMELVFAVAVAWTVLVTTWIVRLLTRAQARVAQVIRQAAAGDLTARVGDAAIGDDEIRVAHDLDDLVERLSELLNAQRIFIASAAHELRSPLTALYGELSLALRRARDAEAYRRTITAALESTRELKQLAEVLLAVARLGAAPPLERDGPLDVGAGPAARPGPYVPQPAGERLPPLAPRRNDRHQYERSRRLSDGDLHR